MWIQGRGPLAHMNQSHFEHNDVPSTENIVFFDAKHNLSFQNDLLGAKFRHVRMGNIRGCWSELDMHVVSIGVHVKV